MDNPIQAMYQAAKVEIPAEGDLVNRIAGHLKTALDTLDRQTAHAGEPALMTSMLHVGGDVHDVLHSAVRSLDNAAQALVLTANDLVNTDDQARQDFDGLDGRLRDAEMPSHSPEAVDSPEAPGYDAEQPMPYPGPPGGTVHVDPTEAPDHPDEDREEREDNLADQDQPELPDAPGREWE